MTPRALILYGYGINCDEETQHGFDLAGAKTEKAHINELIEGSKKLPDYQILALPGGFSFGDDLGAGKVLALKIKYNLAEEFSKFIDKGSLIIVICNGFQALAKLGVLPGTLLYND
ncbi:MAG: phosphoribosylformylglycinamidine synthase subunit PurQ, partial [Nanoarchaeota archaeon]